MAEPGLPPLLPARDVGTTIDVAGERWPTVAVDVGDHPAIADLARVHAIEGIGDVRTSAERVRRPGHDEFLLGIALTTPVRAAFAIAFVLPLHDAFLRAAADAERLVIATTPLERVEHVRPLWLAVDLDRDRLLTALA